MPSGCGSCDYLSCITKIVCHVFAFPFLDLIKERPKGREIPRKGQKDLPLLGTLKALRVGDDTTTARGFSDGHTDIVITNNLRDSEARVTLELNHKR